MYAMQRYMNIFSYIYVLKPNIYILLFVILSAFFSRDSDRVNS